MREIEKAILTVLNVCLLSNIRQVTAIYVLGIKFIAVEQVAVYNTKFRFLDYISDFGKIATRSVIAS